ncbi:DUF1488 family protein [Burkholderia multivorans]|uniref:DUF1488 family protein n=1 Tax=Burkholderia multivorans TaxID=87883 RepID=UPI000CFE9A75|nr:DUF1488 family protein [Burkholderia multivorans]MCL4626092.1 DUF1488 family protein [Burkholderia multivorans]PRG84334.1 hypothetical protein C6T66_19850 [Burkholderia multivorans]
MNIIFPPVETVVFSEGNAVFDAIVDGQVVSCTVTEHAISAAAGVDRIIPKSTAFSIGQDAIFDAVSRLIEKTPGEPVLLISADCV